MKPSHTIVLQPAPPTCCNKPMHYIGKLNGWPVYECEHCGRQQTVQPVQS